VCRMDCGAVMAGGDFYQTCGTCGRRFLSYPKGRAECLSCWAKRCPAVVMFLGSSAGGLMDPVAFPEEEAMTLEEEEAAELFPVSDALLREGNRDG